MWCILLLTVNILVVGMYAWHGYQQLNVSYKPWWHCPYLMSLRSSIPALIHKILKPIPLLGLELNLETCRQESGSLSPKMSGSPGVTKWQATEHYGMMRWKTWYQMDNNKLSYNNKSNAQYINVSLRLKFKTWYVHHVSTLYESSRRTYIN